MAKWRNKPTKKELKQAHAFGEAGFLKTSGRGQGAKGVHGANMPRARIGGGLLSKLIKDGQVTISYQFTANNNKAWFENRPKGKMEVGAIELEDDRLVTCRLANKPTIEKGLIIVKFEITEELTSE